MIKLPSFKMELASSGSSNDYRWSSIKTISDFKGSFLKFKSIDELLVSYKGVKVSDC